MIEVLEGPLSILQVAAGSHLHGCGDEGGHEQRSFGRGVVLRQRELRLSDLRQKTSTSDPSATGMHASESQHLNTMILAVLDDSLQTPTENPAALWHCICFKVFLNGNSPSERRRYQVGWGSKENESTGLKIASGVPLGGSMHEILSQFLSLTICSIEGFDTLHHIISPQSTLSQNFKSQPFVSKTSHLGHHGGGRPVAQHFLDNLARICHLVQHITCYGSGRVRPQLCLLLPYLPEHAKQ